MFRATIRNVLAVIAALCLPSIALAQEKPNFVVIVADDLGWSDPGFLGSSIRTPNLDKLAARGIFMPHFYVAPTCSPTRSMLMTGVSNHAAGVGTMDRAQAANQVGLREYAAQLHDGVVTVAEALSANGYATMMSGKWHLSIDEKQQPKERGFQNSFGLIEGGGSHFADRLRLVDWLTVTYLENGKPAKLQDDFYSSIGYTDKIIEYIDGAGDKPFFAYVAYTAPHDPLQVPDDWLDRYKGKFDDGPTKFKAQRRKRLIELGLISKETKLAEVAQFPSWLDSHKKPWAERDEDERKTDARRMEIYAAMVELLDQQIGRIFDRLEASGKLDNTYIMFMSDNGASTTGPLVYGYSRDELHAKHDLSREAMGKPGSYTTMGMDWANNSNTPFRMFKGSMAEGGVRSPFIVAGPGLAEGAIRKMPGHVMDLTPTIFELAGVKPAASPLYKDKLLPAGQSIMPILQKDEADDDRMLITELFGSHMVRKGRWKAVMISAPLGSGEWELFDIVADPSATNNLAEIKAGLLDQMIGAYDDFAKRNKVVAPEGLPGASIGVTFEGKCNWWCETKFGLVDVMLNPVQRNILFAAIVALVLLGGFAFYRRRRKRRSEK